MDTQALLDELRAIAQYNGVILAIIDEYTDETQEEPEWLVRWETGEEQAVRVCELAQLFSTAIAQLQGLGQSRSAIARLVLCMWVRRYNVDPAKIGLR